MADVKAKEILSEARKGAIEVAKVIEHKAREEAKILLENAVREINEEKQKAQAELKQVSAQLAIDLAGKLIEENLDDKKNRELVNRMIKDL